MCKMEFYNTIHFTAYFYSGVLSFQNLKVYFYVMFFDKYNIKST